MDIDCKSCFFIKIYTFGNNGCFLKILVLIKMFIYGFFIVFLSVKIIESLNAWNFLLFCIYCVYGKCSKNVNEMLM